MIVNLLLILLCIVLSAFFSGSEIAYSAAQELRLEHAAKARGGAYGLALKVKKSFEKALISILVGNNLVNIGASSLATVIAVGLMGEGGAWAATAIMTVLIITFGEIGPKVVASAQPERFCDLAAVPLRLWMGLTWPLTWVLEKLLHLISRRIPARRSRRTTSKPSSRPWRTRAWWTRTRRICCKAPWTSGTCWRMRSSRPGWTWWGSTSTTAGRRC